MQLQYDKALLDKLCEQYNIDFLGLFGSYARGEADENSDIDLLVEFSETPSLFQHVGIEQSFSETLFNNKKVELVSRRNLNKYIAPHVLKDLQTIYENK
jgi:predicted nucleotidyltransferase